MLPMRQTSSIISTYTADVSGVCSALFELGGMTVMHDASGCNSTYNTHDEPRWYDMDSLVFISALTEMDAIMGDDDKLIGDITDAAMQLKPRFIAIAGTPIPMITGFDFRAAALAIEKRTGIPTLGIPTNGMHSYARGAGMALEGIARRFVTLDENRGHSPLHTVNILGATPLDFSVNGSVDAMRELLSGNGFEIVSCWAMGSSLDDIMQSARARVNLVVSSSGLPAARYMYETFGIPYVVGAPFGRFEREVVLALARAMQSGKPVVAYAGLEQASGDMVIVGECVTSCSLAAAIYAEFGIKARVISTVGTGTELLAPCAVRSRGENELADMLSNARRIIADPLYAPICPNDAQFMALPHEAFSGRIYRSDIPNMIGRDLGELAGGKCRCN